MMDVSSDEDPSNDEPDAPEETSSAEEASTIQEAEEPPLVPFDPNNEIEAPGDVEDNEGDEEEFVGR